MALAMRSQAEVTAAAYLPAVVNHGVSVTAFRLQGFGPSVSARAAMLKSLFDSVDRLGESEADSFWQSIRDTMPLDSALPLWRINVPPSAGCAVVAQLGLATWYFDWAGGLIWANFAGDPAQLRAAAAGAGGHAMLVRAPAALRAVTPAFQPESRAVAALTARVRQSFDPNGVFETNRFLDQRHAD
jgi:glycolate oxidase FAD binding subunit